MLRRYQQEKANRLFADLERAAELMRHCQTYVRLVRDTHHLSSDMDVQYELAYHARDIARAARKTVTVFNRINRRLDDLQCRLDTDALVVGYEGWSVAMDIDQKLKSDFDWVQWVQEQHQRDLEAGYATEDTVLLSDSDVADFDL